MNKAIATTLMLAWSAGLQAESWVLDNESSHLSFVTVKAGDLAEAHRFRRLSGEVSIDGAAAIVIDLASVDTLIPIRDERMREHLFRTIQFPKATVSLQFDPEQITSIAEGSSGTLSLDGELTMMNYRIPVRTDALVVRLTPTEVLVVSRKPVVVHAASLRLVEGIEKLREIARLPSISKAVTVNFALSFVLR
ncbi:MAG: YceI family protein [Pseudomonadota bacterium]|nr:YceI family protein [Pseudomonadota bacterium]